MDTYKYLGYHLHEHLSHSKTVDLLANSAKPAFGRIINIFRKLGNMGIKTYETSVNSNILPIANYGSGVWGFKESSKNRMLKNTVMRFYLGTHRFTTLAAVYTEMD